MMHWEPRWASQRGVLGGAGAMIEKTKQPVPRPEIPSTAADLMNTHPLTVSPTTRVGEIARLMVDHQVSGLPVVDETGEMVGLVTQEDMVARHARVHFPLYLNILGGLIPLSSEHHFQEELRRVTGRVAADIMTVHPYTAEAGTPIEEIATQIAEHGVDPVVVLNRRKVVGLITRADLVRLVAIEEQTG
jgi:CBS domain-containing protein